MAAGRIKVAVLDQMTAMLSRVWRAHGTMIAR
jgi:hypothetical protein